MGSLKKLREIRRLRADDAASFRPILIEALIVHPDCFFEDYNVVLSRPMTETEADLEGSGTFGVWVGIDLVGIGTCVTCAGAKRQHCGKIQNLYVKEKYRKSGIASQILTSIISYSTNLVDQLEVEIPSRNEHAVRLFERHGFRMCGLLPRCLRVVGEELDVWTMVRTT